ncbi:MAG: hypothetical protein AAFN11_18240 [Chloroflexota bacterium]
MPTMFEEIQSKIQTASSSILTGGIFTSDDSRNASGGGYEWAREQGLVNNTLMTAHGILRMGDATPYQTNAHHLRASLQTIELYMHADYGNNALLESAIAPIEEAFPAGDVYAGDDRQLYAFLPIFVSGEIPAEEYQNRPTRMIRLSIIQKR